VRNGYTIKLLNKLYGPRALGLSIAGLPGAKFNVVGLDSEASPVVTVPPDELKSVRLYVTLDKQAVAALGGAARNFNIVVTDAGAGGAGEHTEHSAIFQGP
jgi:polyferredoxin